MDVLEVFLILIFGVPIISLLAFGWIAADWMQRQDAGGQPSKPGADAGTPRAAQAKRDAGASGSGVNDEGRQKIQAVRCL